MTQDFENEEYGKGEIYTTYNLLSDGYFGFLLSKDREAETLEDLSAWIEKNRPWIDDVVRHTCKRIKIIKRTEIIADKEIGEI